MISSGKQTAKLLSRSSKSLDHWQYIIRRLDSTTEELEELLGTEHNIPYEFRGVVWLELLKIEMVKVKRLSFSYMEKIKELWDQLLTVGIQEIIFREAILGLKEKELINRCSEKSHYVSYQTLKQTFLDTRNVLSKFDIMFTDVQKIKGSLYRILALYARLNGSSKSQTGLSILVAVLKYVIQDEENTFWALIALMENPKYLKSIFHSEDNDGAEHFAQMTLRLMDIYCANIRKNFNDEVLKRIIFGWLHSCFAIWGNMELICCIWTDFILNGKFVLFKAVLFPFCLHEYILKTPYENLIQSLDSYQYLTITNYKEVIRIYKENLFDNIIRLEPSVYNQLKEEQLMKENYLTRDSLALDRDYSLLRRISKFCSCIVKLEQNNNQQKSAPIVNSALNKHQSMNKPVTMSDKNSTRRFSLLLESDGFWSTDMQYLNDLTDDKCKENIDRVILQMEKNFRSSIEMAKNDLSLFFRNKIE